MCEMFRKLCNYYVCITFKETYILNYRVMRIQFIYPLYIDLYLLIEVPIGTISKIYN